MNMPPTTLAFALYAMIAPTTWLIHSVDLRGGQNSGWEEARSWGQFENEGARRKLWMRESDTESTSNSMRAGERAMQVISFNLPFALWELPPGLPTL